jgi:2-iminobutanoate/2-iminopropanoate deaminase
MSRQEVTTKAAPAAVGPYSQAIDSGCLVFCSGQLGIDPITGELLARVEDQAERALLNLEAVLAAAGLTSADVVKTTIFLTDMTTFGAVNAVYEAHFEAPAPARSTVAVAALPRGAAVEIEAIARRSE